MSKSAMISVGWPVPTNLKFSKEKAGRAGHKAIFSWTDISPSDILLLDPSGGGFYIVKWRVMINDKSTYLVQNKPIFELTIPQGCCELCVKVQTIYDLSSVPYTFTDLATSDWCDKVCVPCDPDKYCESDKGGNPIVKTQNAMSENMRYALAMRTRMYGSSRGAAAYNLYK